MCVGTQHFTDKNVSTGGTYHLNKSAFPQNCYVIGKAQHVLPRARSMADACAYSVRGARFSLRVQLHSLGVTDTNIHIIIARMQPGLGCLVRVYSAIISYRILYCSSLESNYQRF